MAIGFYVLQWQAGIAVKYLVDQHRLVGGDDPLMQTGQADQLDPVLVRDEAKSS